MTTKSEAQLACELIKLLDGVSIERAHNALTHAIQLLSSLRLSLEFKTAHYPLVVVREMAVHQG